jgi:hypothetical protein
VEAVSATNAPVQLAAPNDAQPRRASFDFFFPRTAG